MDDETEGWEAFKSVGYCGFCGPIPKRSERSSSSLYKEVGKPAVETPPNESPLGSYTPESDDDFDDNDEEILNILPKGKKKKKSGRKAIWINTLLSDAVDIIVNDEVFRRQLIFRNTKNQRNTEVYAKVLDQLKDRAKERDETVEFTPVQLRTKFKKAISECKKAALTMKTATGIKRLQDEKGYGPWFDQLFALVKTRDSRQPEQAIEPSIVDSKKDMASSSSASTSTISDDFFVPSKKASRKRKTQDTLSEAVEIFKTVIQNDPMKDFIAFAQEEAEKARQHELRMMELLLGGMGNAPPGRVQNQ
eukprot:Seg3990.6 transcript_id=Seg3990.6/GoldUCD/mRNA.D3Y31 product="hypothetical protein" protein_id=Seg3990.6/GoldUCD/D3Y31